MSSCALVSQIHFQTKVKHDKLFISKELSNTFKWFQPPKTLRLQMANIFGIISDIQRVSNVCPTKKKPSNNWFFPLQKYVEIPSLIMCCTICHRFDIYFFLFLYQDILITLFQKCIYWFSHNAFKTISVMEFSMISRM